jgi:hypothetical protein
VVVEGEEARMQAGSTGQGQKGFDPMQQQQNLVFRQVSCDFISEFLGVQSKLFVSLFFFCSNCDFFLLF